MRKLILAKLEYINIGGCLLTREATSVFFVFLKHKKYDAEVLRKYASAVNIPPDYYNFKTHNVLFL